MASIRLCFYDDEGEDVARLDTSALSFPEEAVLERARCVYGDAELCERRVTMVEQALLSEAISLLSGRKRRDELSPHLRNAIKWPDGAVVVCIIIQ